MISIVSIGLITSVIGAILGTFLYRVLKKIKGLKEERQSLIGGNTRLLGEIKRLEEELDRYKNGNLKIELTMPERRILLNALESPHYRARIAEPETRRFIRIIYNTLRKKIRESIKE